MIKKKLIGFGLAVLAIQTIALGAGYWDHLPTVGIPANTTCESFGSTPATTPGNCNEFKQVGPVGVTGSELIPADTGISNNGFPQTTTIPTSLLGNSTNRLIGGDMTTNLNQRPSTTKG